MKYLIIIMLFIIGCSDPLVSIVEARYPQCKIVDISDGNFGYTIIKIKCPGGEIKELKMKER